MKEDSRLATVLCWSTAASERYNPQLILSVEVQPSFELERINEAFIVLATLNARGTRGKSKTAQGKVDRSDDLEEAREEVEEAR